MAIAIPTREQINAFFAEQFPAGHAAGYRCDSVGPGYAVARWPYDATQLRPGKLISGATQFTAADLAFWFLSFTIVGLAPMVVTSELYITYLCPAAGGDLIARAELLRAGKTKISGSVRLWIDGAPDRPVSQVVGSYIQLT